MTLYVVMGHIREQTAYVLKIFNNEYGASQYMKEVELRGLYDWCDIEKHEVSIYGLDS